MKHTVVLGSYNRPRMVKVAIRSVLEQTHGDFELIVTDDGSNGETMEALIEAVRGDSRARLLVHPGPTGIRPDCFERACHRINEALAVSTGECIHYLGDDDWYATTRLACFDTMLATVPVAYGRLIQVRIDGEVFGEISPPSPVADPMCILDHNQVAHRRECLAKVPAWQALPLDAPSDGRFFHALAEAYGPIPGSSSIVAYKRYHDRAMLMQGIADDIRE